MKNHSRTSKTGIAAAMLLAFCTMMIQAEVPDGFIVYSANSGVDRTLYTAELKPRYSAAQIEASKQKVCTKGSQGGDIQSQISFDGKIVAFARSTGSSGEYIDKWGGNDYHEFGAWDVYVVRVDGDLPATPVRVGNGYWPSWGEDSYNDTKTLYYSTYSAAAHNDPDNWSGTIRAVTVGPDLTLSNDREVLDVNAFMTEYNLPQANIGFMMCAPSGTYFAGKWREHLDQSNEDAVYIAHFAGPLKGQRLGSSAGCMPSITADSRWIINAHYRAQRYDGTHSHEIGGDQAGEYMYGTSVDMDWLVTWSDPRPSWESSNKSVEMSLYILEEFDDHIETRKQVQIPSGGWPDVHVWSGPRPVEVLDFWGEPSSIVTGKSTELRWRVLHADSVAVNGETVDGSSLSKTPSSTTTYTLTAYGLEGPLETTTQITVGPAELTTLKVTPARHTMLPTESVTLSVEALDQSGDPFDTPVSWTAGGGGSLSDASGTTTTFTSDGTMGKYTVTATAGTLTFDVAVSVLNPGYSLKIQAGHFYLNTPVPGWVSGGDYTGQYVSEYLKLQMGQQIDTAAWEQLENAAPIGVYGPYVRGHKAAGGRHDYSIGEVPDYTYLVRMHFTERAHGLDFFDPLSDMSYEFEGKRLINHLNLCNQVGKGTNAPAVRELYVTVSDGNGLQIIGYNGPASACAEAGIEIYATGSSDPAEIIVMDQHKGNSYTTGDTLDINWSAFKSSQVLIELSLDKGRTWMPVTVSHGITANSDRWGWLPWAIQPTLHDAGGNTRYIEGDSITVRVSDYSNANVYDVSQYFAVELDSTIEVDLPDTPAIDARLLWKKPGASPVFFLHAGYVSFSVPAGEQFDLALVDDRGRTVHEINGTGPAKRIWRPQAAGVYFVRLRTVSGGIMNRKVVIVR